MSNRRRLRPGPYRVQESAPTVAVSPGDPVTIGAEPLVTSAAHTRTAVHEASIGGVKTTRPGRMLVRLIRAGISLNRNAYSEAVLVEAARNRAFPQGLGCYIDHASEEEEEAHPSGSVKNLAAVLTEDARWDEESQSLVAEVRLFAPWRETLTDMAEHIGMSIRAWVTGEHGTYEGREAFVVDRIEAGRSVDFVTVPAAGGAIVSVLEAVGNRVPAQEASSIGARIEARLHSDWTLYADNLYADGRLTRAERITLSSAVGDGLAAFTDRAERDAPGVYARDLWDEVPAATAADEAQRATEAPTDETRTALANAIRAAHADQDEKTWAWLKDFDPEQSVAWFEIDDGEGSTCWQQSYTVGDDGTAALTGDRVEVVARTVYQPVTTPGDTTEAAPAIPATATAVTEDVTDGAPPTAPNPPIEEEPVSGTQTGAPPVQAGTATVVDTPPANTTAPAAETVTAPAQEAPRTDPQVTEALASITSQLAEMQQRLTAETARADQRDAENRALRNNAHASEAVTTALRAPEHGDVAAQIGPRVSARILAAVPTTAEGAVDETRLGEAITAAIADEATYVRTARAEALEAAGVGIPRGLGGAPATEAVDDGFDAELGEFFSDVLGMTEAQSKVAVKGRTN